MRCAVATVKRVPYFLDSLSFLGVGVFCSIKKSIRSALKFIKRETKKHKDTAYFSGLDLLDNYLDEPSPLKSFTSCTKSSTEATVPGLIIAPGSTCFSQTWLLLYLAMYPNYQVWIRDQIKEAVGSKKYHKKTDHRFRSFYIRIIKICKGNSALAAKMFSLWYFG